MSNEGFSNFVTIMTSVFIQFLIMSLSYFKMLEMSCSPKIGEVTIELEALTT